MKKLIIILCLLTFNAHAVAFLNIDFYYTYAKDETSGFEAKESASSFLMLGFLKGLESGNGRLGLTYRSESKGETLTETMIGPTIGFGSPSFFVEFTYCPGTLKREFEGYTEKGSAMILTPGFIAKFGESGSFALRVTLPIIQKSVDDAISKKELLDYFPHLGLSFAF